MVMTLTQASTVFSAAGIGPKARNGLPFYAGRYVDPATGMVRLLPKASSKFVNPVVYTSKLSYLQARLINKWNDYVMA
jgi:hypothetical protein